MNDYFFMASDPITGFQRRYMSFGDMLGEWFYGFLMVAVVVWDYWVEYSEILLNKQSGVWQDLPHCGPAGTSPLG